MASLGPLDTVEGYTTGRNHRMNWTAKDNWLDTGKTLLLYTSSLLLSPSCLALHEWKKKDHETRNTGVDGGGRKMWDAGNSFRWGWEAGITSNDVSDTRPARATLGMPEPRDGKSTVLQMNPTIELLFYKKGPSLSDRWYQCLSAGTLKEPLSVTHRQRTSIPARAHGWYLSKTCGWEKKMEHELDEKEYDAGR